MNGSPPSDWDLSALRRRLGTRAVGFDIAEALDRWRAEGRAGNQQAFLDWVLASLAEEQVNVTAVLPPRLTNGRAPAIATEATMILDATMPPAAGGSGEVAGGATGVSPHTRYVVVGQAGKGGMAVVHIARDLELMRKVALKRLAGSAAAHDELQARFMREVQISAQLDHPNIVPVYGLEVGADGIPAYAMKLVEGLTLEEYLRETRAFHERAEALPETHTLPTRLEHFLKVCDAIAYAHDKGVVHRDLKPANVMLGRYNEIYVMDWGICRVMRLPDDDEGIAGLDEPADGDADTRTRVGTIVGTARYMAPEQAQGRNDLIGPATDQYALGLMLFEVATLQPPYEGRTAVDVLARAARGEIRPIRHAFRSADVPAELAAIIGRATAADPAGRYRDMRAFATDVRRYLRGDEVEARPDTLWQKAVRNVARHRQAVLMALVALIAVGAIGAAGLLYRHDRALVAAQEREHALLSLVDHVTSRGDLLQTRFLELQGELDVLAATAGLALQHTPPGTARFYWVDDYDTPAAQPPDLVAVGGGEGRQSFTFGAWSTAAGTSRAGVAPSIRRLTQTRAYRNELFQRARALFGIDPGDASAAGEASGTMHGSGIESFVIGLASGAMLHLPGHAALPRDSDPRQAPWYRIATGQSGGRWGLPYADGDDSRLVVPLAQAIRADDGRELGVTAMLLSLDLVISNLLRDAPDAGVRATLLLDSGGRVIASSGPLHPHLSSADSGQVMLEPFPDPALLELLRTRDTGYLTTDTFGERDVVAFDTIHPLEWVLVKVAAEAAVIARSAGR